MILTTEEVITETLNVISASTKVILATEEVISITLKNYLSRYKSDLGHWRRFSDHSDFKKYLSLYKSDLGHWRSGQSHFENYLSH